MESHPQEALFVLLVFKHHPVGDVHENFGVFDVRIVGQHVDLAQLRGNEHPVRAVAGVRQQDGPLDAEVGERLDHFQVAGRVGHFQRWAGVGHRGAGQGKQFRQLHAPIVARVVADLSQHDQIQAGHHHHAVAELAHGGERVSGHALPGALAIVPPQVAVALVQVLRGVRGVAHPGGRNQLVAFPLPFVQRQQAEPRQSAGRDMQAGVGQGHAVAVFPTPIVFGDADLAEHLLVENLRQVLPGRLFDHGAQQRQAGVVVFPLFARLVVHGQFVEHIGEQVLAPQYRVVAVCAGGHREQLPHGDLALQRRLGFREKLAEFAVERQLAVGDGQSGRRAGERLRGGVDDVLAVRGGVIEVPLADDLAVPHDKTGLCAAVLEPLADSLQALGRHGLRFRLGDFPFGGRKHGLRDRKIERRQQTQQQQAGEG